MLNRHPSAGWCSVVLVFPLLCGSVASGQTQSEQKRTARLAQAASDAPAESAVPVRGPKYLNLRYDEDFSYLDGSEGSYTSDYFDAIKNINLGDDWRLSLGGEFRFDLESETNKAFGSTEPANDTFTIYRYLLHADVKYRDLFRVFVQGVVVHDEGRDLAPRGSDENILDIQQLFFDVRPLGEDNALTLRVGRQELQYGKQRFVSPLDWAAVRRRFDGVKLFWSNESWNVDAFYAKPVPVQRRQNDQFNEDFDFYGVYSTYKAIARHTLDFYFFGIDNVGNPTNPNGKAGDVSRYTLGSRFQGRTGPVDYEAELAGQWGKAAGDTIQAWSLSILSGYTFAIPSKVRLGLGFDWATGDDDPTDGSVGTFDQMFPLGHAYFGYLDLVGRQNITAANVNVSGWFVPKKVKGTMTYHTYWLSDSEDALYNAGGGAGRRDATGSSGRDVGSELDLTVVWKLDTHSKFLFGYSHFWSGDFVANTGPGEDADLFYMQYQMKF